MAKSTEYDVIIIGGGTAGCVVASRLHQLRPDLSIALVERGPDARDHPMVQKPLAAPLLPSTGLMSIYESVPQEQFNGRRVKTYAGNMLSGSSAANYGLWMRGSVPDYDLWAQIAGDERWSYKGLLPYFRKIEHHFDETGDMEQHGFDGPIHTTARRGYPLRDTVLAAYKRVGYEENGDGNSGKAHGIHYWTENWREGKRQAAGSVYDLSGVTVMVDTAVHRIMFGLNGDSMWHAVGVELKGGQRLGARRQVVLSAGAIKNPQILMLSGVGPAEEIQKHGILPLVDLPGVGQNYWDHLSLFQWWRLKNPEKGLALGSEVLAANPKYALGMPADFIVNDRLPDDKLEPMLRKDSSQKAPNWAYPELLPGRVHHWMMIAYGPMGLTGRMGDRDDLKLDGSVITTGALLYLPSSRGAVTLASADPDADPVIDPRYYSTESDRVILRTGVRRLMEVMHTPEMQEVVLQEIVLPDERPLTSTSPDEEIDQRVARSGQVIHHASGTCAIGTVVDHRLRVKGISNLRVIDSSVFPTPISATTQASVYALAESAADLLAKGI